MCPWVSRKPQCLRASLRTRAEGATNRKGLSEILTARSIHRPLLPRPQSGRRTQHLGVACVGGHEV